VSTVTAPVDTSQAGLDFAGRAGQAGPRSFVPLREGDLQPDARDGDRIRLVRGGWADLDDLVRQQNRQIEENVRMLANQQHILWHPVAGRYLDVTEWMTDEERKWRVRPVVNRLLPWFVITHARATENQPIVSYVPGPDRADAELAEVLDIASKSVWFEANMEDAHDRVMAWVIVAGRGHLLSRINPHKGRMRPWVGQGLVPIVDEYDQPVDDGDGGQAFHMAPGGVPFGPDGQPRAKAIARSDGAIEVQPTGEPHATPVGTIEVDVLAPMQVRASWGPEPWHMKRRHYIRSYHSPEQVYEWFGVDVAPTVRGGGAKDVGELERLLYGTGFYQVTGSILDGQISAANTEGYVELTQLWEAPCSYGGMDKTDESPGGRWTVVTPNEVIRDGVRPADFPYVSPLNTFEFIRIPGRPGGTTPQEALNPLQRMYNATYGQVREHVNLVTNPKGVIDAQAGLAAGKFTNRPGENYVLNRRPGIPAIEYVAPPDLGADVYKLMTLVREEMQDIGFMTPQEQAGDLGTSGEQLKEARFNTDRFLGPTMRRTAGEYGRMFATWRALYPLVWDMETTISYAGEDNIARTISVYPDMFKNGYVNVRPDVESMLPEGRGERQQQVYKMYLDGLFGMPGTPAALRKFWEMARFPHLGRAAKPGGIHTTTAEQENGKLLLGTPAEQIPVFEWYDDEAHLATHEFYMASPEFLKQTPEVQNAFVLHRMAHQFSMQRKMAAAVMQQAATNAALAPPGGAGGTPTPGKPQPSGVGARDARPPEPSRPSDAPALTPNAPTPLPQ
jgi:hypothetical protein